MPEHRQLNLEDEVIQLPFYGGAKGSILRFVKNENGSVSTMISPVTEDSLESTAADDTGSNHFSDNLQKIQKAASKLVTIQQLVKASGKISADEKQTYVENLNVLGQAAQALAQINQMTTDDDEFRLLITGE